jgi:hypothetical protein
MMKVFALWKNFYSMFGLWFNILTAQEKRKHLGGGRKKLFWEKKRKIKGGSTITGKQRQIFCLF